MREIRSAQYASYIVIASAAIGLLLVLYSLTDRLQTRIGALVLQTAAHGQSADASSRPTAASSK